MRRAPWLLVLALARCASVTGWDSRSCNVATVRGYYEGQEILLRLTTQQCVYAVGDSVDIAFSLTNLGHRSMDFWFGDYHGFCHFTAHEASGIELWRQPEICLPVVVEISIPPHETRRATATWHTGGSPSPTANPVSVTGEMFCDPQPTQSFVSLELVLTP